jgi:hypothetical protein
MTVRLLLLTAAFALSLASPALAGPPLLCFPFEIGSARSLPVGTGGWESIDPRYDASRLTDDTLALLTPETPIVVRMETLRRATLYAARTPAQAAVLLDRLQQRATVSNADTALAVFDFGYLAETYKQATHLFGAPMKAAQAVNGYRLVEKAAALRDDPAIAFALAVMTRGNTRIADAYRAHVAAVLKAAPSHPAIAANLERQFGGDLRTTRF